jgi:hypothetical protein
MKTSRKGLRIDEEDWKGGVKMLTETLDKFKVPNAKKRKSQRRGRQLEK